MTNKIRNPKSEIRKKSEVRKPNSVLITAPGPGSGFRASGFGLLSDFGFRILVSFGQPLFPVFRKLIHIRFAHRHQRADIFHCRRIFFQVDLVDQMFDRAIAPFVTLLGQQQLHVAAAQICQLRRQSVHRDALDGAGRPFERVVGEQRPAADHRPAVYVGIGLHNLLYLGGGVVRRFFMVIGVADRDSWIFPGGTFRALDPLLQVGRVWIPGEDGHHTFPAHNPGQLIHDLFAAFDIIHAESDETFAGRRKRFVTFGVDDVKCGEEVMDQLARVMGGKGVVAILAGNPNAPNLQKRVQGAKSAARKYPGITIRDTYYHKETAHDAAAKVEQVMQANPDINGWAMIGGWPLFTDNALKWAPGAVKCVSVDALPPELAYLRSGHVQLLLAQQCYEWGYRSVEHLVNKVHLKKDPPAVKDVSPLVPVSKANVDEFAKNWEKWLPK